MKQQERLPEGERETGRVGVGEAGRAEEEAWGRGDVSAGKAPALQE